MDGQEYAPVAIRISVPSRDENPQENSPTMHPRDKVEARIFGLAVQ